VPAILPYTRKVIYPGDKVIAELFPDRIDLTDMSGTPVKADVQDIPWSMEAAEKEGYEHFMLKEIFEQPDSLQRTISGTMANDGKRAVTLNMSADYARTLHRVTLVACG